MVIAIIAVLAALLFPAGIAVQHKATLKRAGAEIKQVEAAITAYKIDKGFYPPDNKRPNGVIDPYPNSLYYELTGARVSPQANQTFVALDGSETNTVIELQAAFRVGGINNVEIEGAQDVAPARNYIKELSSAQYALVDLGGQARRKRVMGVNLDGPFLVTAVGGGNINPLRYVSSSPTNNPETFDLWVDLIVGGKTNRVCNWSDAPIKNP